MARPASDIAERIVHAARDRFLLQGVDGASLRAIAADAKTSIGMVYYYFKTKDDLFFAVVEEVYGELLADFTRALGSDVPPEQRIARLYQRIAAMDEAEFKVVRLILREALISGDRLTRLAERFEQGHVPLVMNTLAEGVAGDRFDSRAHPMAIGIATATLAILPQIMHRLISAASLPIAQLLPSREDSARALFDVLLFGIAGPALPARAEAGGHGAVTARPRDRARRRSRARPARRPSRR